MASLHDIPSFVSCSSKSAVSIARKPEEVRRIKKNPRINKYFLPGKHEDHPLLPIPRPPKTVEIISSEVIGRCECVKRNGLQHDCPKIGCQGHELCLTWPLPTCQPSGLGEPVIIESYFKIPEPAKCDLTIEEKKIQEKKAAMEKRKEEDKFIEDARFHWKAGVEHAERKKQANAKDGFMKCEVHSFLSKSSSRACSSKGTQTCVVQSCDDFTQMDHFPFPFPFPFPLPGDAH